MQNTIQIKKVTAFRSFGWLIVSSRLFLSAPLAIITSLFSLIALTAFVGLVPKVGSILASFVSSMISIGVYRGLKDLQESKGSSSKNLFVAFQEPKTLKAILMLTLGKILSLTAVLVLVAALGWCLLGTETLMALIQLKSDDVLSFLIDHALKLGVIVCIVLGALAVYWSGFYFILQLIAFNGLSFVEAFKLSFRATWINWLPFTVWGLFMGWCGALICAAGFATVSMLTSELLVTKAMGGVGIFLTAVFLIWLVLPTLYVFGYQAYFDLFENPLITENEKPELELLAPV